MDADAGPPPVQRPLQPRRLLLVQREDKYAVPAALAGRVLLQELRQALLAGAVLDHLHGLRDALVRR